ncbi:MAG: tetratricopeptide repeat protein [Acidobacteriota bacterium]|nr:MAG: tetratricopeptide repeat protein [Acidobacteriota bacterium]
MRETLSKSTKAKAKVKAVVKSGGKKSKAKTAVRTKPVGVAKKSAGSVAEKKPATSKKVAVKKAVKTVPKKAAKAPVKAVKTVKAVRKAVKPVKSVKPVRKAVAKKVPVKARKKAAKAPKKVTAGKAVETRPIRRKKLALPLVITPAPLPPEPPRRQMSAAGLKAFEQAVKLFNRRQYPESKTAFENLAVKFPQEVEIISRAQTYIHVCAQKLAHTQATPRNADELYDRGVFALNIGDFTQARSFFEKALRLRPDEPYLLYSLAATHAQTGSHEQALDYLRRSIQIQPRFRAQALHDSDFSGLRENKRFLELLGLASPFDLLEARK